MKGFVQHDINRNRHVHAAVGQALSLTDREYLLEMMKFEPLDKYEADYNRMKFSLEEAIKKANHDENSRQIFVQNDDNFYEVLPCFTSMHFVYNGKGFALYIYQRSSDLEKWEDDMVFFGSIMKIFEEKTKKTILHLVVFYGNVHYEIEVDNE